MGPTVRSRIAERLALLITFWTAFGTQVSADDRRIPWTTSRFAGTPDPPPPYTTEPAFPSLRFEHPVVMAPASGNGRLFVGEQGGKVYSFPNAPHVATADLALDLARHRPGMTALYGLAFHPKFHENRFVYLCYVMKDGAADGARISRFSADRADPPSIDPTSEVVVLTFPSGGHNGGCLAFGPDGALYISTGDAEVPSPPDRRDTGQDVGDLLSSILRIDVDHAEGGRNYRVPPDNPFVKLPGARPEIWAFGFRNPWRMSFDRKNGDLWVGDVGWELWELVDRVVKGGNYGWSIVEGRQPVHPEGRKGPTPILPPTAEHPHSEAASITGGYVYRGERLRDLIGVYVYGDFQSGKLWGLRHDGTKVTWQGTLADTPLQLVAFGEDRAGELYLLDYERTRQLHRLIPNPAAHGANRAFPRRLSDSGLFTSTREQTAAPGVVPYAINAPLWSDGASAERWLAVPGAARIVAAEAGIWRLPDGAVLARTVSVEQEPGNPATRTRVETQVLHREEGSWRPYSYLWNDSQTDAALVEAEGTTRTFAVGDPSTPGKSRSLTYRVAARAECVLCHNPWVETKTTSFGRQSASPLGLTTSQLNRPLPKGKENQLRAFERLGLFENPPGPNPDALPRMADPGDPSADLGRRARAYLQVNCAHCHQSNAGGSATIQLTDDLPLDKMQAVGVKPSQGSFGIADARIISPGDPEGSALLYRVSKLGGGRMPRIGTTEVDDRAVKMLGDWIESMPRSGSSPLLSAEDLSALKTLETPATPTSKVRAEAVDRLLATTRGALALSRRIDRGSLSAEARRLAVSQGAGHANAEVRELFERYVPESQRVARLGASFDPKTVLALNGDARRGREVFLKNPAAQCKTCHRLDGEGIALGPDLSKVGAKYARADMLRHILEPSRAVDPPFATYVLETKAGKIHSGLLASRSARAVVLKDASNRETRIPTAEVEQMVPQPRSLMPESLLRDLTARQAADLLEYLGSLK